MGGGVAKKELVQLTRKTANQKRVPFLLLHTLREEKAAVYQPPSSSSSLN